MTRHATIASDHARPAAGGPLVRAVRWTISPDALRAYAPAIVNGHASELAAAELRVELHPPRAALVLTYARGDRAEHALPLGPDAPVIERDEARGLTHVELAGAVALCLRTGPDGAPEIVYAQTPLLAAIGLPGGVYDVPSILPNNAG